MEKNIFVKIKSLGEKQAPVQEGVYDEFQADLIGEFEKDLYDTQR